jgi:hypothetical protein
MSKSKITCPFKNEPIIEFYVCPSPEWTSVKRKENPNFAVPNPIKVRGLIDTGFDGGLLIHQPLLRPWGLKTRNFVKITSIKASTEGFFGEYAWETDLCLRFEIGNSRQGNVQIDLIPATLVEFMNVESYTAIIGCQILQSCTFVYDGPKMRFTLAFHKQF